MVWYGMVWYGMVWYGMVWYGMVWYGMVWYGMVWYGMYTVRIQSTPFITGGRQQFLKPQLYPNAARPVLEKIQCMAHVKGLN